MRLLLDTHIWLWYLLEPRRLSAGVIESMDAADSELWLSPVSIWELLLLAERGRFTTPGAGGARKWIDQALTELPLRDAPLTREVALRGQMIRIEHRDPADRFLAATAAAYDLVLVTSDEPLLRGEGYRTLANR